VRLETLKFAAGASQKLRTLGWYLQRPALYAELAREIRRQVRQPRGVVEGREAERWCAERAIDVASAVERLTGAPMDGRLENHFAERMAAAVESTRRARAKEPADIGSGTPLASPMAGRAHLDLLYWLTRLSRAERVVETGVAFGWSSLAVLLAFEGKPGARLVSTDMPIRRTSGAYVGSAVPLDLRHRWTLLRGPDRRTLPKALRTLGTIDLCHYDSDKSYDGRRWAYPLLWSHLRPGGFFVSDDINDNDGFRDFATEVDVRPVVVEGPGDGPYSRYVGVLVKPA
jgi:predicted O-methyltransferase YrrM